MKRFSIFLLAVLATGCASTQSGFYGRGMRLDREGCGVREYGWWDRSPRRCSWYGTYSDSVQDYPVKHEVDRPG
jgi:hypothetical protein